MRNRIAGIVAVLCVIASTARGQGSVLPRTGALHTVTETSSGRCLGYVEKTDATPRPVAAMECNAPGFHEWIFVSDGRGFWAIADKNTRMCLQMAQDPAMYRAPLSAAPCVDRDAQRWRIEWKGGAEAAIVAKLDGRCMQLNSVRIEEGPTLNLFACGQPGAQETWRIAIAANNTVADARTSSDADYFVIPAKGAVYRITETTGGKCLGYTWLKAGWVMPPITGVVCNGSARHEWQLTKEADGFYSIGDGGTNVCVAREQGATIYPQVLRASVCAATDAQKWRLLPRGDRTISLVAKGDGRCALFGAVDVEEGRTLELNGCGPLAESARAMAAPGELWRLALVRGAQVASTPSPSPRDPAPPGRRPAGGAESSLDRMFSNMGTASEFLFVRHFPVRAGRGARPSQSGADRDTWHLRLFRGQPVIDIDTRRASIHSDSAGRFRFLPTGDGSYLIAANRGKDFLKVQGDALITASSASDASRFIVRGDTSSLTFQLASDLRFVGSRASTSRASEGDPIVSGTLQLTANALEDQRNFTHWQLVPAHRQGLVQVQANQEWFDTGIDLFQGETFQTFDTPTDRWSYSAADQPHMSDAWGMRGLTTPLSLMPANPMGQLIGKVGTSPPFAIGGGMHRLTSPASGRLFLSMNDVPGKFRDNLGSMGVVIY